MSRTMSRSRTASPARVRPSLVAPYEQASISTSIKIDELDVLGMGNARRGSRFPALHASGWLEILDEDVRVFYGPIERLSTGLRVEHNGARKSRDVQIVASSSAHARVSSV